MKEKLKIRGLRQRWMLNSIGPIMLCLVVTAVLVSVGIASSYYSSAQNTLLAKAKTGADYFNTYTMGGYGEYYRTATLYTETFEDSDHIELQFINSAGRIQTSTQGLSAGLSPHTADIEKALSDGQPGVFNGKDTYTGESILSVSSPLVFNGSVVGVMRYVTATRNIDRQILFSVLAVAGACLLIGVLIFVSNLIFISNVVAPVAAVTEAAQRISNGSYGIQVENKYSDEMGELVDNINNMSTQISQSEKMQTEFISSVSHELRTPLTAINGWGETLMSDESGDVAQLRRGLGIIMKEAHRLTNMVEELLEFSKIQNGRFTLRMEEMDLQAEFEDAIYTYRELFRQDGIALEYDCPDEPMATISGDPERLKQVMCNLLDNAAKHGGSGKRIRAELSETGEYEIISIRDWGPGIPEAELPFVKQKFYKGSSKARGSGIGLAVCDEIVNLHGGTFTIANADGGGTVVTVSLPMKK
jgi:two-component system OmpR family sensor kinase